MYGNVPPGQLGKIDNSPRTTREILIQIDEDIQSVKRHLIFLEEKQDKHETLTADLIQLYKGATIVGRVVAWLVSIAGGVATLVAVLVALFGDKK